MIWILVHLAVFKDLRLSIGWVYSTTEKYRKLTDNFGFLMKSTFPHYLFFVQHVASPLYKLKCNTLNILLNASFAQSNCNQYSEGKFTQSSSLNYKRHPFCLLLHWKIFSATNYLMLMPGRTYLYLKIYGECWHTNCSSVAMNFPFM